MKRRITSLAGVCLLALALLLQMPLAPVLAAEGQQEAYLEPGGQTQNEEPESATGEEPEGPADPGQEDGGEPSAGEEEIPDTEEPAEEEPPTSGENTDPDGQTSQPDSDAEEVSSEAQVPEASDAAGGTGAAEPGPPDEKAPAAASIADSLVGIVPNSVIVGSQTIASLFPDTQLAGYTAGLLGKNVNSTVTQNELNSITTFNPSGAVHNAEGIQYLNGVREMRLDNLQLTQRFPDAYLNDVHPNLNYYIANNQNYTNETITIYDKNLQTILDHIPPLIFQIIENSNGRAIGTWNVLNANSGIIDTLTAVDGTELIRDFDALTPGRYTVRLTLANGVWMDLDNSIYNFPLEYIASTLGSISGTVTDENGQPMAGVTISIGSRSTTTLADGTYEFEDVEAGPYSVTASFSGYNTQSKAATVTAGQNTVVDFSLQPQPGVVAGTVLDSLTGLPIEGAEVILYTYPDYDVVGTRFTDESGNYQFDSVARGTYQTSASADNYNTNTSMSMPAGNNITTVLDILLDPIAYTVSGHVYIKDTAPPVPIPRATVVLPDGTTLTTDDSGYYTTKRSLFPGSYVVRARADTFGSAVETVVIPTADPADQTQDFYLERDPGTYTVIVTDTNGDPVVGATATITYPDGSTATVQTGTDGRYVITVPPGDYSNHNVSVSVPGFITSPAEGRNGGLLASDQNVDLPFVLTPITANISGTVTESETGGPVAGAGVNLVDSEGKVVATTNAGTDGSYAFSDVGYGNYTVIASAGGYNSAAQSVAVQQPVDQTVNLVLTPNTVTLNISVRYYGDEAPVPGALIQLDDGHTALTDASGNHTFTLAPGTYSATASRDGYTADSKVAALEKAGDKETLVFELYRVPALRGGVTDAYTMLPLDDVELVLTDSAGSTTYTGEDGLYAMQGLEAGTYTLTAQKEGYQSVSRTVVLENGRVTVALFTLMPSIGTLSGTVVYANGSPAVGITIELVDPDDPEMNRSTATDESGYYNFWLYEGQYHIVETADEQAEDAEVQALQTTIVDFVLPTPPGRLYGYVTNAAGSAVGGATVTAWSRQRAVYSTTTDTAGFYEFAEIEAAAYTITASKAGEYASQTKTGTVPEAGEERVDFALQPLPGGIHGTATWAYTGEVIPGALVTILPDGLEVYTDVNGYYSFVLTAGTYDVTAEYDGEGLARPGVQVPDGTLAEVDFVFGLGTGTLRGRVTDASGSPLAGATITAANGGLSRLVLTATTEADGSYSFTGIDPASYSVTASLTGYDSQTKTGEVLPFGTAVVDFVLAAPGGSSSSEGGSSSGGDGSSSGGSGGVGSSGTGGGSTGSGSGAGTRIALTADHSRAGLFFSMALIALAGIAMVVTKRKSGPQRETRTKRTANDSQSEL